MLENMPSCSVQGCKAGKAGLHRLPVKDIERGKTWLVAIKNPNYNENTSLEQWKNIRVCSKHFKSEDFKTDFKYKIMGTRSRTELKEDAIPSIFPWTFDSQRSSRETSPPQSKSRMETAPYEESCPEITFDVSEFTFVTDEENNCANEEAGEVEEENNSSNEEEEEEEIADSDWGKEDTDQLESDDSDQLESDDSDERDLNFDSKSPKSVRQLCPECGTFFFTCKTHTCEYKIKPFSCNICGKRCVDESALKAHSNIHKESYEHPCKFCMAPFNTRLDKLAHEGAHIPSARPYKCPDCSMAFSKLPARNLHLKGHRGPKIFSCPHCAMEFPTVHYLDRHVVVHTGMKQFVCQFCSRSFNQPGHLKSHLRVHTGEKPFQCRHCDKSFNHNVSLKSHVMQYHKGASDSGPSGHMKRIKKTNKRSSGRPKGRPKRNAATGETNSIAPAVRGEALDPITAADTAEQGHLRSTPKDIESDWSDRDPTSELAEEDKVEESKTVRKSKRKASQRANTFYIAEKDFQSDSDSNPAEEAKKRQVVKSQET